MFRLLEKAPLPPAIIASLRNGVVPKRDEIGTYLFADIVGFTAFSSRISAKMLVKILNSLFVACDEQAVATGVTKVKTLGDCYVAAAGILGETSGGDNEGGHAGKVCKFALRLHDVMRDLNEEHGLSPKLYWRIGVHTGSCIGGVIGSKKFVYDLWGSAVTRANKMEERGKPGMVRLGSVFACAHVDECVTFSPGVRVTSFFPLSALSRRSTFRKSRTSAAASCLSGKRRSSSM